MNNEIEGIIYKVQAYLESNRLLFVYTREGKKTLNARGSQKLNSELRVLSQYLTKIAFEVKNDNSFINITKAKLVNPYNEIKRDFNKVRYASLMFEIINKVIIDDEYNNKVYQLLEQALNSNNTYYSALSFALKMTYFLGYGLNLKSDSRRIKGLSIKKGGLVYENEHDYVDLDENLTLQILKLTYTSIDSIHELNELSIKTIETFIYQYYLQILEIRLKTIE